MHAIRVLTVKLNKYPTTKNICFRRYNIGNGKCDKENNYPECNYDGGDCQEPINSIPKTEEGMLNYYLVL